VSQAVNLNKFIC